MLQLEPDHLHIVKSILKKNIPKKHAVIFGSRVTTTFKPHSDIDICVMDKHPLSFKKLADLREAFSESDLPMRVDIVDWASITPEFRAIIKMAFVEIQ